MKLLGYLIGILICVPMVAFLCIIDGMVLNILWSWFMVPKFNAPLLGIPTAIGISLISTMLTHQRSTKPKEVDPDDGKSALIHALFLPWFILIVGCVVKQFI